MVSTIGCNDAYPCSSIVGIINQAAQATFKSIKSVIPLLDRVLVQRFKADTVCFTVYVCEFELDPRWQLENGVGNFPSYIRYEHAFARSHCYCGRSRGTQQGR